MTESKRLTLKEMMALTIEERRKLLTEQSNDPEIIAYYQDMTRDIQAMEDKKVMD